MNYIEQINSFWLANEEFGFLPTDIALYFYLLKINNACNWKETFKRNNAKIMADLSISYKTLHASRQRLQKFGIISFQTKNGNPNVTYNLGNFSQGKGGGYGEVWDEGIGEVTARYEETKDKLNKTKLNKTINPPYIPPGETMSEDSENEIPDNEPKQQKGEKEKSSAKKEKEPNYSFEEFWDAYDKKVGKKETLIKKWLKLSDEERELAMSYIPKYKQCQPDKQYRKNPETFLNNKSWNDELIFKENWNGNRQLPANNQIYSGKSVGNSYGNDAANKRAELDNLENLAEAILRNIGSPNG